MQVQVIRWANLADRFINSDGFLPVLWRLLDAPPFGSRVKRAERASALGRYLDAVAVEPGHAVQPGHAALNQRPAVDAVFHVAVFHPLEFVQADAKPLFDLLPVAVGLQPAAQRLYLPAVGALAA